MTVLTLLSDLEKDLLAHYMEYHKSDKGNEDFWLLTELLEE